MKESYLWQKIKGGLEPAVMTRIENTTGAGVFDVAGCFAGVNVWIELKVFKGNRLHFRNSQRIWGLRMVEAGATCFVLAEKNGSISLYRAKDVLELPFTVATEKSFSVDPGTLVPLIRVNKPVPWQALREKVFG